MVDSLRCGDFIALCAETWREGALLFQSWLILEPTTGGLYVGSVWNGMIDFGWTMASDLGDVRPVSILGFDLNRI